MHLGCGIVRLPAYHVCDGKAPNKHYGNTRYIYTNHLHYQHDSYMGKGFSHINLCMYYYTHIPLERRLSRPSYRGLSFGSGLGN